MIIANSIGAFFAMHALSDMPIETEEQMRFLDNWPQSFIGSNLSVK